MSLRICSILLIILCVPLWSLAQDPSFSQFYANRIYLNPALTGIESGLSLAGVSRIQWVNVDEGFRTYGVTLETQEPHIKSAFGLSLFHDTQGLAQLNTTSVGLSYAYTIPFHRNNIHIGLQGLWTQKTVDWSDLIFSDQLDPIYGNVYSSSHVPILEQVSFSDFNLGIVWRSELDFKIGQKVFKDTRTSLGLALSHAPYLFNRPEGNESFQNLNTRTAPRITIHGGLILPAKIFSGRGRNLQISPNFKLDLQGNELFSVKQNLKVITYGFYILYEGVYFGAFYQNKHPGLDVKNTNALILTIGAYIKSGKKRSDKKKMFVGFSFDANTTGVGTRAGSVYEIAFRYTFENARALFKGRNGKDKKVLDCPSFY